VALTSFLFQGCSLLERCAVSDSAHVLRGAFGPHVRKIQAALFAIQGDCITALEWNRQTFGVSTEAAVLKY
jgi:hypothetical protein